MQRTGWRPSAGQVTALFTFVVVGAIVGSVGAGMFSPGSLNADHRRDRRLGGVNSHADLVRNCSACHAAPWSGLRMADLCMNCHTDIRDEIAEQRSLHGTLANQQRCSDCHTEHRGAHAPLTDFRRFDHSCTRFPLTGKHEQQSCSACHTDRQYRDTPRTCVGCHAEPEVPRVHRGNYGTDCAQCHNTTGFAIVQGFDHNRTAFPLTGAHMTVQCAKCHVGERFQGTSRSCVSCHAEPPTPRVHKGNYGPDCAKCHTTTSFKGATFTHTFPVTHGKKDNTCSVCHFDTNNYAEYTCYGCHKHQPDKIRKKHLVDLKILDYENCVRCHARGKKHERRGQLSLLDLDRDRFVDDWIARYGTE